MNATDSGPQVSPNQKKKPMYAPVVMFVYNRTENTRHTLEALMRNTLAPETDLYVFSDGGRDKKTWNQVLEVRRMLMEMKHQAEERGQLHSMTIVERGRNVYLEENIMQGIELVMLERDRIIVLEDDIVTGPYFLQWMNDALTAYRDNERVMHVSGFTNLDLSEGIEGHDFYFTPHMSGWGWATWREKWKNHFRHFTSRHEALEELSDEQQRQMEYEGAFPCLKHLDKDPIPWDICWEIAIKRANGLCLTPKQTMVRNIGLYSGTHFSSSRLVQRFSYDRPPLSHPLTVESVADPQPTPWVEDMFRKAIHHWGIVYTPLGKMMRWVYYKAKGRG